MNIKSVFQNILSLKNVHSVPYEGHWVLTLLGIKFKFKYFKHKVYAMQKIDELETETKLLRSLFKNSIDITKIPPTRGNLRTVQLIKTKLLEIADYVFRQNNIKYWLDYGTLIGAIRHHGFIPWDDDVDICIMWDDYIKIPELFKSITEKYPDFILRYFVCECETCIRFGYKEFHIDFFPRNYTDKTYVTPEDKKEFEEKWQAVVDTLLYKILVKNKYLTPGMHHTDKIAIEQVENIKKEIFGREIKQNKDSGQIILSAIPFRGLKLTIIDTKCVFPLQKTKFENLEVPIPADPIEYLYELDSYGEKGAVMDFPTFKDERLYHTQAVFDETSDYYTNILENLTSFADKIKSEK